MDRDALLDFLEWAKENSKDAFEIWEDPESLVDRYYMEQHMNNDEEE